MRGRNSLPLLEHDVIMHSHLLRLSAAMQTQYKLEEVVKEQRTTQDAIEMRWPSANRRRRLFVLCHVVWHACPSWSMDNLASDSRRTWCHALGLAWSSSWQAGEVEKEASTKTTKATITKYYNFLLLPEVC